MYLVDFLKRLVRKSNVPVMVYLSVNVLIIAFCLNAAQAIFSASGYVASSAFMVDEPVGFPVAKYLGCLASAIFVYAICLVIALSPLGEWILRLQTGCSKIQRKDQIDFLEPIFREVYERAKKLDPSIPDDVELYIEANADPNAFAIGRKTICITEGLLRYPVEEIKAVLAHEFGHLAHKDTDVILVVSVGNLLVNLVVWLAQISIVVLGGVSKLFTGIFVGVGSAVFGFGWLGYAIERLLNFIITVLTLFVNLVVVGLLFKGWVTLGFWMVQKSSRDNEFEADEFSFDSGYGKSLCTFLAEVSKGERGSAEGLFAVLAKSHPDSSLRIARLQSYGVDYAETYGAGRRTRDEKEEVKETSNANNKNAEMNEFFADVSMGFKKMKTSVMENISNAKNAKDSDAEKTPNWSMKKTSTENVERTPRWNVEETSAENVERTPRWNVEETSAENVERTPRWNVEETSTENVERTPNWNVEETPSESDERAPRGNFCPHCGNRVDYDDNFCTYCGTKLN